MTSEMSKYSCCFRSLWPVHEGCDELFLLHTNYGAIAPVMHIKYLHIEVIISIEWNPEVELWGQKAYTFKNTTDLPVFTCSLTVLPKSASFLKFSSVLYIAKLLNFCKCGGDRKR